MNFDKHAQTAKAFLRKLAAKLGDEQNISKASGILRSTLHVLRNQSTTEESLQLISQLPMFIKAVYVDGWKPGSNKSRVHHLNDFVLAVHKKNIELGHDEFVDDEAIFHAIEAVFKIIRDYVSDGEIEDFKRTLPKELHILIEN